MATRLPKTCSKPPKNNLQSPKNRVQQLPKKLNVTASQKKNKTCWKLVSRQKLKLFSKNFQKVSRIQNYFLIQKSFGNCIFSKIRVYCK